MTSTETSKRRRRGEDLKRDIFAAASSELSNRGYGHFSIEGVAVASGTSKASIYRRWRDRDDLLVDTINFYFPQIVRRAPIGEPFTTLKDALEEVVTFFNSELGQIAYTLLIESRRSKRFTELFDKSIAEPRRDYFRRILLENYKGEDLSTGDLINIANVASSLLIHNVFVNAPPVDPDLPSRIIEDVIKPLSAGISARHHH